MFIVAHASILLAISVVLIAIGSVRWLVIENKKFTGIPIFILGVALYVITFFYAVILKPH